jgi:hypothetical protein
MSKRHAISSEREGLACLLHFASQRMKIAEARDENAGPRRTSAKQLEPLYQ